VNQLYEAIQKKSKLKESIKIIGIGAGNSPFEVDFFRKKYKIPFPLFSDQDLSIHKVLGEVRTPYFIGVRINPDDNKAEVFYSKLGAFKDPNIFLDQMIKLSGVI